VFHVVLYQPEIPPNTGNIVRLCANTGAYLHLVGRLGFELDDRRLRRAGLDYHEYAEVVQYPRLDDFLQRVRPVRMFALSTRSEARFDKPAYRPGDAFLFGPETRGLPEDVLDDVPAEYRLRLPMCSGQRSLNLSNAVAVMLFEAWRQQGFAGAVGVSS